MFLAISFLAALAGVGLAAAAAFLPETGVNGSVGAFLAVLGAVGVTAGTGILLATGTRTFLVAITALIAMLTALAAWFLMQDALLAIMGLSLVALLVNGLMPDQRKAR
jgi:hypothetical protein